MKEKPVSHKNQNTFRFLTFVERLNNINIDVIHHIGRTSQVPEEADTFFLETLEKWTDLNYTEDFGLLRSELGPDIKTLSQIVFRKEEIINILGKCLDNPENLAIDATLELTVSLARDLQCEFYQYFEKFFLHISHLLKTTDTELLEKLFSCLAYLFKFLWRYMIKDINNVYRQILTKVEPKTETGCTYNMSKEEKECTMNSLKELVHQKKSLLSLYFHQSSFYLFSPLLSDKNKDHVRNFAAESFAFLLRKVSNKQQLFEFIFKELEKNPEQSLGLGQLLFEVVKGVKKQFHSCTKEIFPILLKCLGQGLNEGSGEIVELPWKYVETALFQMINSMAKHTSKDHAILIEKMLCDTLMLLLNNIECKEKSTITEHLNRTLPLFLFWIQYKEGILISSSAKITQVLLDFFKLQQNLPDLCVKVLMEASSCLLLSRCVQLPVEYISSLLSLIYSSASRNLIFSFTRQMFPYGMFEKDVLPCLLAYCLNALQASNCIAIRQEILALLCELITFKKPLIKIGDDIKSFSKLPLYSPVCKKRCKETSGKKYTGDESRVVENFLIDAIEIKKDYSTVNCLPQLWSALICLPHIRTFDIEIASEKVGSVIKELYYALTNQDSSEASHGELEKIAFVFSQAVTSYIFLNNSERFFETFPLEIFGDLIKQYSASVSILRSLDIYLTYASGSNKPVTENFFSSIFPYILTNLASPFHIIRLLTLRILHSFDLPLPFLEDEVTKANYSIFHICLEAETIPLTVHDYREKLKWLQKLEYASVQKFIPLVLTEECKKAPVYYLLGMLYVNFSLLWKSTQGLLESHAHGMSKIFWEIFNPHLYKVVDFAERNCMERKTSYCYESINKEVTCKLTVLYMEKMASLCHHTEIPDHVNHRYLLWKTMGFFTDIIEPRNKDVVPLLFRYVKNEVAQVDNSVATSQMINKEPNLIDEAYNVLDNQYISPNEGKIDEPDNVHQINENENNSLQTRKTEKISTKRQIKAKNEIAEIADFDISQKVNDLPNFMHEEYSVQDNDKSTNELEMDELDNMSEIKQNKSNFPQLKKTKNAWNKGRRGIAKTLAVYLSVFAKFKNPKAFYKNKELLNLYFEFLSYHHGEIQKIAFDCIMTYNYQFLIPYKDNFYRLLDEKTFKTEVVLFSIDEENELILQEHRMNVLPVLMRILYGKMLRKTGTNNTGKNQAYDRRALILRFLAGCREEELKIFLDLVFDPFKELVDGDVLCAVRNIKCNLDLSSIIPIYRQRSALIILEPILKHLGSLVPGLLPWLLKVLLVIATTSTVLLEKQKEIHTYYVGLLKDVRTKAFIRLIQFFRSFDQYNFTVGEIDAIFEALVWPMLPRLEFEALHNPPPLLRLFVTWSYNPRYFIFFGKYHENLESLSPLPHLMALYTSSKVQPIVIRTISKMLNQLLTLQDYIPTDEDGNKAPVIAISNCVPVSKEMHLDSNDFPNYGTLLLLPYISMILKRLRVTVMGVAKNPRRILFPQDLNILLRISEYVEDSMQCTELIELLISITKRQKLNQDSEVGILSTICNLIKHVEKKSEFLRSLAPLFSTVSHQQSRMTLTAIVEIIEEGDQNVKGISEAVNKINAWNPEKLEEPDYLSRLDGQKIALQMINEMQNEINIDFIRIIIYNSTFAIRMCDDTVLQNSATNLLQRLVVKFSEFMENHNAFQSLVLNTLLPEIQKGLTNEKLAIRHAFIEVLAALLHSCGNHPNLKSLLQLCDKDPEMDFWENICHLQVHRRARALTRFARNLNSKEIHFHPHVIMTYIMPIVSSFLFDSAYKKRVHVIDAAIEAVGAISHVLPWSRYESILRYYLRMLSCSSEHHKTVVRLIVAILNSFHFDLSASRGIMSNLKEPPAKKIKNVGEKWEKEVDKEIAIGEKVEHPYVSGFVDPAEDNKEEEKQNDECVIDADQATKIHHTIVKRILPQLHRSLMRKTRSEDEHKLAGSSYPEDEEVLRVPVALAMVKLLQNLPHGTLQMNLPGLFLRMCQLLKSRAESIRESARGTILKMMQSLGPSYFEYLLHEMKGVMKKGYQVHVMTYTINSVLTSLEGQLKVGHLDSCIISLTEVCINELFTDVAEEKEVAKIIGKVKEAKSSKSYSMYQILGKYISESFLLTLITPLKEILVTTHSHKTVKKVQECLRQIVLGLTDNSVLSVKGQLIFIHAIAVESIPDLNKRDTKIAESKQVSMFKRPDIYLLPKEPPRGGIPAKTNIKTNAHILVDFSLQLLHSCFKRDKLSLSIQEHLEMLDPFVAILAESLQSQHVKIISSTLRCLMRILKFPLPSLKENISHITSSLFVLLNKYAGIGMAQGDNFEMVVMCFKMLTILVRDADYHSLNEEQLHVLLSYIEQDIYDHTRQATAFTLLKAILSKKLQTPELKGIMGKIAEMSVTSEQDHIRTQCRQVFLQYLLDYPLGKQVQNSLAFCVAQLEYWHEPGRVSAIEMLNSIFASFPENALKKYSGLFLVPLAARLVNDEATRCKKMSALAIINLLKKIDHDERTNLFSVVITWLQSKKLSHKRLGVQLSGLFADVEGDKFERHLSTILPILEPLLEPGQYANIESATDERCTDHFLYHLLSALSKIFSVCPIIRSSKFEKEMNKILDYLQHFILHPNQWVRVATSQLFGHLFSCYPVEEVIAATAAPEEIGATQFFMINTLQKLRDMSADFSTQLQSPLLSESLGDQIIKNLIYLAKVICRLPYHVTQSMPKTPNSSEENQNLPSVNYNKPAVSLEWMIRKLCREAKKEVIHAPQNSLKRRCVFKFLAALALDLGKDKLLPMLPEFLTPLCREISDSSPNTDETLKTLAQEVLDLIQNVIGIEEFTIEYAKAQSNLLRKKTSRKREAAFEAVTNPQKAARKKIKKQLDKREAKKRTIAKQKGKKHAKKRKLTDIVIAV